MVLLVLHARDFHGVTRGMLSYHVIRYRHIKTLPYFTRVTCEKHGVVTAPPRLAVTVFMTVGEHRGMSAVTCSVFTRRSAHATLTARSHR